MVVLAFGSFALYYLQHPGTPTWNIGTGNDGDQYMNISVGTSQIRHFPWGLWTIPDLGTVVGFWNCSLVMGLFTGGFLHAWGFYPGVLYWVWTMVALTSLFCVIPYVWQRHWGYSGIGGIIAGVLLATSPTIRDCVPQVMSDTLGMLLLGVGFLCLARLVIRERWRDVVIASACLATLGLTRSSLLFQLPSIFLGLALSWFSTAGAPAERRRRAVKFSAVVGLTLLWLCFFDASLLARSNGRSYLWDYIMSAFGWARLYGPMHNGSTVTLRVSMWVLQHHAGWVWLAPLILIVMGWAWKRRPSLYRPMVLVFIPWLGYIVLFLGRAGEPRHLLPWLLMEALLLGSILDEVHRVIVKRPARRWAVRTLVAVTVSALIVSAGRPLVEEWRAALRHRAAGTAYMAWARAHLPDNALIVAGPEADPWWIAEHTRHPVICPIDPYHGTPLYVDPARLRRHPFLPTKITVPQPMTQSGMMYLLEHYERLGNTLWILDAAADPTMADGAMRTAMPGTFGYHLVGLHLQLQEERLVFTSAAPDSWKLYQLVRVPSS